MYRKSITRKNYERKVAKCAAMRAAKNRLRMERTSAMRDVGGFVTDGCLGAHTVRLLAWADGSHVAVRVDGKDRQARTLRGVVRILAGVIFKKGRLR
jgi:hypothetical protein